MTSGRYILGADGRTPVECEDLLTWARWYGTHSRRVAYTELPNGHGFISTVFLGLDHRFGGGRPILFETMSQLGGEWEDYAERYCTWAEAEAGHAAILARVFEALEHGAAGLADALTPADTVEGGR